MGQQYQNIPGQLRIKGQPLNVPPNSSLSGTYEASVACLGDLSLSGNTVIAGDLTVSGKLTNPGGYALTVHGNCTIADYFDFTTALDNATQGNFTVYGDLVAASFTHVIGPVNGTVTSDDFSGNMGTSVDFAASNFVNDGSAQMTMTSGDDNGASSTFTYGSPDNNTANGVTLPNTGFYDHTGNTFTAVQEFRLGNSFRVNLGQSPKLIVYGNLSVYVLDGTGKSGAAGLEISVSGSVWADNINVGGGVATATDPGGNGGRIVVRGDVGPGAYSLDGGNSNQASRNGGAGGIFSTKGDCHGTVSASGGSGTNGANSGNGGTITVYGDAVSTAFEGGLIANGGVLGDDNGSGTSTSSGNGGTITVYGDASGKIEAMGGSITSGSNFSNASGTITSGNGGNILVRGQYTNTLNTNCHMYAGGGSGFNLTSTNGLIFQAGNGGTITVYGTCNDDIQGMDASGGGTSAADSSRFNGGNGGTIVVRGTRSPLTGYNYLFGNIGCVGGPGGNTGGTGGNGGSVTVMNGAVGVIDVSGGDSHAASVAGRAGTIALGPSCYVGNQAKALDGTTGTAPTSGGGISFFGSVQVKTLSGANRASFHMEGAQSTQVIIGEVTDKATLWNGTTESANISTFCADSIFKTNKDGTAWYRIQGTSI